jgi:hypothetical protein
MCLQPLGTQLDAKVIRPFVAQGVQSQNLQKPILVIVITGMRLSCQSSPCLFTASFTADRHLSR